MILGCFIFLLSLTLSSLTKENQYYQVFLSQAVGMGFGVGILFLPTNLVAIKHFRTGHAFIIVSDAVLYKNDALTNVSRASSIPVYLWVGLFSQVRFQNSDGLRY